MPEQWVLVTDLTFLLRGESQSAPRRAGPPRMTRATLTTVTRRARNLRARKRSPPSRRRGLRR
eukprot:11165869-Alexandrium_andersonii.AAC.1